MSDELVTIKIEVNADTRAIDKVKRKLRELRAESKLLNGDVRRAGRSLDDMSRSSDRLGDSADRTDGKLMRMGRSLQSSLIPNLGLAKRRLADFFGILNKATRFGLKVFAIQTVALSAGLLAVSAAFKVGSFAAKAWQFTMTAAAGAAASVAAALATAAAAVRQYQAAMNAVNYTKGPLGSRQAMTGAGLRAMQTDPSLQSFGPQAIQGGFAALSKNARYTGDMSGSFRALGDFAVASGDMEKGLAAAGAFLGMLRKNGKVTEEAAAAAADLGTEFEVALENAMKLGTLDEGAFLSALKSGKLNDKVSGLLDGVDKTLVGQLKKYGNQLMVMAADTGQFFLPEVQTGLDKMFRTVRVGLLRVSADLRTFGAGDFIDTIVSGTDKATNWMVDLFEKYLPKTDGFLEGIGEWFSRMADGGRRIIEIMRPLQEGGRVLVDTLAPVVKGFFGGLGESMQVLNRVLIDNKADFVGFGEAFARILDQASRLFNGMKALLGNLMPGLRAIAEMIANIADSIMDVVGAVAGLIPNAGGGGNKQGNEGLSLAMLGALGFGMYGMRQQGKKGRFGHRGGIGGDRADRWLHRPDRNAVSLDAPHQGVASNVATMNVTAGVVNLGQGRPGFAPGQGGGLSTPPMYRGSAPNQGMWQPGGPPPYTGAVPGQGGQASGTWRQRMMQRMNPSRLTQPGSMVAPMAMMAATPLMAPEAQTPMMLGGMVGMLTGNPMLGVAAGGLGGAFTAKTPVGGAALGGLGGAAAGFAGATALAASGAALGTVITPIIGTAIGAAIGLIAGGIMGAINAGREKDRNNGSFRGDIQDMGASNFYTSIKDRQTPEQFAKGMDEAREKWGEFRKLGEELDDISRTRSGTGNRNNPNARGGSRQQLAAFRGRRDELLNQMVQMGMMTPEQASWARRDTLSTEGGSRRGGSDRADPMVDRFRDTANAAMQAMDKASSVYDFNVNRLAMASGKTTDEITKLASEMGVNLYDASMTATDGLNQLGMQIPKTLDEMNAAMRKSALEGIDEVFNQAFDAEKGQEAINQAAEDLRSTQGALSDEQKRDFSRLVSEQAFALFPDDAFKAMQFYQRNLTDPNSPQFNNPDAPLYGRSGEFLNDPQIQKYNEGLGKVFRDAQEQQARGSVLQAVESSTGGMRTADMDKLNKWISTATPAQLEWAAKGGLAQFEATQKEGSAAAKDAEKSKTDAFTAAATGQAILNALGIGGVGTSTDVNGEAATAEIDLSGEAKAMYDAAQQGIKSGFAQSPSWYRQAPPWYNRGITVNVSGSVPGVSVSAGPTGGAPPAVAGLGGLFSGVGGDTTTSRLAATMAKHNHLNSAIAGKRSVISSLRDTGLGSLNSDHLTGNAYDLTGQNLGAYQKLVQDTGGFAEFHNDGGRHLHVVPGTSVDMPAGDTATPMVAGSTEPVYVGNGDTFNLVVNGSPGQSVQALAREVEAVINKKTRSRKERR